MYLSVICVAGHVYMDLCGVYVCLVCVPAENTSEASLWLRPGDMEQGQPHLSQAAENLPSTAQYESSVLADISQPPLISIVSLKEENLHPRKTQNRKYSVQTNWKKTKLKKISLEPESLIPFHSTLTHMFLFST